MPVNKRKTNFSQPSAVVTALVYGAKEVTVIARAAPSAPPGTVELEIGFDDATPLPEWAMGSWDGPTILRWMAESIIEYCNQHEAAAREDRAS